MKKISFLLILFLPRLVVHAQGDSVALPAPEKNNLRISLNQDGSRYFQFGFTNQTWLRYTDNNPGTTRFGRPESTTFDIGLRRTRLVMFGQVARRTFVYFQFGQNNFNSAYNANGNRKIAAFFHDAVGEYQVSRNNALKLGAGLTIMNGLSRFSQPSVSSIMTTDVPVFLQYSVDQIDQFDRRLAVYARGELGKFDYRIYLGDPFPINSNGSSPPPISLNAGFVDANATAGGKTTGIHKQVGGYFAYNFFENEPHTTPYMQGTYLGSKKIWNIAAGFVYQDNAMWRLAGGRVADTVYSPMFHMSLESYFDIPLNKDKGTSLNAFAGFYNMDYGYHYLRFAGSMNPGTGLTPQGQISGGALGNAFPMFGTGHVTYGQLGYLLPRAFLGEGHGALMPYASAQYAEYPALQYRQMLMYDIGINWLISGNNSKLSLDLQTRPTYKYGSLNEIEKGPDKRCIILQYQVSF